uniref:F-box domain-containing protein n=1 Tax=Oryza punctata TaxID=4537 RepID=A0A0E0LGJ6_ORYPU
MDPSPSLNNDDATVAAILLRLPPDDPSALVRLSLVSKCWRRVLAHPDFLRRYRARHHRTPPMLGFYFRETLSTDSTFVPAAATPLLPDLRGSSVCDARHGRVLVSTPCHLAVFNPIAGAGGRTERLVPFPKFALRRGYYWQAAVLCAADGCVGGDHHHLDCHGGHFRVVLVATYMGPRVSHAGIYSSHTGMWTETTSVNNIYAGVTKKPSALVGDTLYFPCVLGTKILEYNMSTRNLQVFSSPTTHLDLLKTVLTTTAKGVLVTADGGGLAKMPDSVLTTAEGGRRLGFAAVVASKLFMWSRAAGAGAGHNVEWIASRTIDLNMLPDIHGLSPTTSTGVIGFADGVGVIFIRTDDGVFTVEPGSERVKMITSRNDIQTAYPYISFYSKDLAEG